LRLRWAKAVLRRTRYEQIYNSLQAFSFFEFFEFFERSLLSRSRIAFSERTNKVSRSRPRSGVKINSSRWARNKVSRSHKDFFDDFIKLAGRKYDKIKFAYGGIYSI
jgi:hypothetical protein